MEPRQVSNNHKQTTALQENWDGDCCGDVRREIIVVDACMWQMDCDCNCDYKDDSREHNTMEFDDPE